MIKGILCASLLIVASSVAQAATVNLVQGASEDSGAQLYMEQSGVAIGDGDVDADFVVGANLNVGDEFTGVTQFSGTGQDVAGGQYNSFIIHFDPLMANGGMTEGEVEFANDIVAIIVSNGAGPGNNNNGTVSQLLNDSDAFFGFAGSSYEQTLSRRSENSDTFQLQTERRLSFFFRTNNGFVDNVRVLTVAQVPVPAGAALLLTGLVAFGALRRKS